MRPRTVALAGLAAVTFAFVMYRSISAGASPWAALLQLGGRVGPTPPHPVPLRVLVTGGAGFIGFTLAAQLHARGDTPIVLDNFNEYYDVRLKEARAQNLTAQGIKVVRGDVCDEDLLERMFARYQFDAVVHLAAQAGVRYSIDHPQEYVRNNIECFVHLLERLRHRPTCRFIYASSSSVYGSQARIPFALDDPADHQTSLYGASKRSNELIARAYMHLYNLHVTGLRFFTVYGEWGRPDMAMYDFVDKIHNNKPITVYGYGQMRRDFTHVDDIVSGIIRAVDYGGKDELFNIGYGNPVLLDDFITMVEKSMNKIATKNMQARNLADLPVTFCDTSYTQATLGYQPAVSVQRGVQRFVAWYEWYVARSSAEIEAAHELLKTYTLEEERGRAAASGNQASDI